MQDMTDLCFMRLVSNYGNANVYFTKVARGAIKNNVNMRTTYGFTENDYDHSGQFNRPIQQLEELYQRIFEIVK